MIAVNGGTSAASSASVKRQWSGTSSSPNAMPSTTPALITTARTWSIVTAGSGSSGKSSPVGAGGLARDRSRLGSGAGSPALPPTWGSPGGPTLRSTTSATTQPPVHRRAEPPTPTRHHGRDRRRCLGCPHRIGRLGRRRLLGLPCSRPSSPPDRHRLGPPHLGPPHLGRPHLGRRGADHRWLTTRTREPRRGQEYPATSPAAQALPTPSLRIPLHPAVRAGDPPHGGRS